MRATALRREASKLFSPPRESYRRGARLVDPHGGRGGGRGTVGPAETSLEDVLALEPAGVFLSNGPGDPAATGAYAVPVIAGLLERDVRQPAGARNGLAVLPKWLHLPRPD